MGPPLQLRRWQADTVREAARSRTARRLREVMPDEMDPVGTTVADRLRARGWRPAAQDAQPRFVFRLPLTGRTADDLWRGFSSQWRRNIKKANASGVKVTFGGISDISEFYRLLRMTQQRNGFDLGRQLPYFERQYRELNSELPGRLRLFLAVHDGDVLGAHILVNVGTQAWYLHGASADHNRSVRPSNALQWMMIRHAHARGATDYDMRGVKDCLDPDGPDYGLLRWKLGTGGHVAENLGEWELVLNRPVYLAFRTYLAARRR
jgi:lipid II:glycine glycyltransferase (peptidoglycan interpeptide bridge formation enzyme)